MTAKTTVFEHEIVHEKMNELGPVVLGPLSSYLFRADPRRISVVFARHKFCSKMLAGKKNVLEVGCADGTYTRILLQSIEAVHGVDYDPRFIEAARAHAEHERLNATYAVCNVLEDTIERASQRFDGAVALDVLQYIPLEREGTFLQHIVDTLSDDAICLFGQPNRTSEQYASRRGQNGHINLKSADELYATLETFFENVFIFSMNDEVVHTGFQPMAHYLIGMGVGLRK